MRETARKLERQGFAAAELPEALLEAVSDAEAQMVHLCSAEARVLNRAKKLRLILSNRGGLENIDISAVKARDISVLPHRNVRQPRFVILSPQYVPADVGLLNTLHAAMAASASSISVSWLHHSSFNATINANLYRKNNQRGTNKCRVE